MIDHVVVDVEIQRTIEETPGGWDATDLLGIAAAALWEFRTDRMRIYGPDDVPALIERLDRAERISGFNIDSFDFAVILALPRGAVTDQLLAWRAKSNDLLARIWDALGKRERGWKLDQVAESTLGVRKIGDGAEAPKWWQAGQVHRVINYCADDVAIERDLTLFVDKHGFLCSGDRLLRLPDKWPRPVHSVQTATASPA